MRKDVLMRLIERQGGVLRDNSTSAVYDYAAEAPLGKVWAATGTHEVIGHAYRGDPEWGAEARAALAEDIAMGVEDCLTADCDWCNPEEREG